MNLETVLMCAKMAASMQRSGLGHVDPEIESLIAELTPAPVEEPAEVAQAEAEAEAVQTAEVEQVPEQPAEA